MPSKRRWYNGQHSCLPSSNPGSNPGHGMDKIFFSKASNMKIKVLTKHASAGNRTRINCLEGSYADHYTTDA